MKEKFFLFFLIFASCFFFTGCSAGTPEEQQELAQALQSFGQENETSSGWDTFFSQLEGEATAEEETSEASWGDVLQALKEAKEEEDDGETAIPWDEIKNILTGGEVKTPTPTPIPAEPTSAPEPTASPTPTPTPMPTATPEQTASPTPEPESEEDDGFHLFQKLKDFVY